MPRMGVYLFRCYSVVGPDLRVDVQFPHPARYQLIVLPSEIQDQYLIHYAFLKRLS